MKKTILTIILATSLLCHSVKATPAEDFQQTKAKAEQGDAWAQLHLSDYYRNGEVVERNYAEALKWARKAADQNDPLAQYIIACFYSEGWGVEKNEAESFKWHLKAAYNGLDMSQKAVARHYYLSDVLNGVDSNAVESYAWLNIAAKRDKESAQNRDNMEKWMTKEQIAAAQKRALELSAQIRK